MLDQSGGGVANESDGLGCRKCGDFSACSLSNTHTHTHTHTHTQTHTHTHRRTHAPAHAHAQRHTHMHKNTHACVHTHTHTYTCAQTLFTSLTPSHTHTYAQNMDTHTLSMPALCLQTLIEGVCICKYSNEANTLQRLPGHEYASLHYLLILAGLYHMLRLLES